MQLVYAHHDKVDKRNGIGVDPEEMHATKHVKDDHTDHQHKDGSRPNVQTKHQDSDKEHSS